MKKVLILSGLLALLFVSCGKEEEECTDDSTSNTTVASSPTSGGTEGIGEGYWD